MVWDLSLLRKYSSSNHSRISIQLKSELKANPLVRKKSLEIDSKQKNFLERRVAQVNYTNSNANNNYKPTESLASTPKSFTKEIEDKTEEEFVSTVTFNNTNIKSNRSIINSIYCHRNIL